MSTIVETETLLRLVGVAFGAGVGITAAFSLMIYGLARFTDMRRSNRGVTAGAFAVVALVALAVCAAMLSFGFLTMLDKE